MGALQLGDNTAEMAEVEEASTVVAERIDPACDSQSLSLLVCLSGCASPSLCVVLSVNAPCRRTADAVTNPLVRRSLTTPHGVATPSPFVCLPVCLSACRL